MPNAIPSRDSTCFVRVPSRERAGEVDVKRATFGKLLDLFDAEQLAGDAKISFDGRQWSRLDDYVENTKADPTPRLLPPNSSAENNAAAEARPLNTPAIQARPRTSFSSRKYSQDGRMLLLVGYTGRVAYILYLIALLSILVLALISFVKNTATAAAQVSERIEERDARDDSYKSRPTFSSEFDNMQDRENIEPNPVTSMMGEMLGLMTLSAILAAIFFNVAVIVITACLSEGAIAAGLRLSATA